MIATKEQEIKALDQIRKIVEGLGPDSYIATAFEGCFEIAEENIENDFACSMKQRVEATVVQNSRLKEQIAELEKKLAESEKDYEAALLVAEEKNAEIARLKALALSDDDMTDCVQMARDRAYEQEEAMNKAAAAIVELAGDPTSHEFTQAVKDHRNAKASKEYAEALIERLQKAGRQ